MNNDVNTSMEVDIQVGCTYLLWQWILMVHLELLLESQLVLFYFVNISYDVSAFWLHHLNLVCLLIALTSYVTRYHLSEGIACTERHDAYVTAVQSVLDMSPGRTNEEILAVFADGALNHTILQPHMMDLFIWDSFHLYSDVWPKQFRNSWCDTLSSGLNSMLYANSKEDFDGALAQLQRTSMVVTQTSSTRLIVLPRIESIMPSTWYNHTGVHVVN